jgi:L-lactate dehydrogenase complex protein LldG
MSRERVMQNVRRALGRSGAAPAPEPPPPPHIDEPIVRLVQSAIGLPELFVRMARQNQMVVEQVRADEVVERLIASLRSHACRSVALSAGGVLEKLRLTPALQSAGFVAKAWDEMTLDELYDVDAGVTEVRFAVAETGSLVIDGSSAHGRALSLVPPVHVAVVEPKNLLPDLVDLFDHVARDAQPANTVVITGPSKTADIEMNLVTGVHGPGVVHLLLLS